MSRSYEKDSGNSKSKTIKASDLVNVLNHLPGDTAVDDISIEGVSASMRLKTLRGEQGDTDPATGGEET